VTPNPGALLSSREYKKRQTRKTLVAVAVRLFAAQGYAQTTLVEVANKADIAPSTFFNYFPSKADVVFDLIDTVLSRARARVESRPIGEPLATAILSWAEDDLPDVDLPDDEVLGSLPSIIAAVPELRSAERLRLAVLEDILTTGFARDLGEPTDGIRARIMATIALRGMLSVWDSWQHHHVAHTRFDPTETLVPTTRQLEQALSSGLAIIESLPRPPTRL
jgi:AcrR family transcriptional regulator